MSHATSTSRLSDLSSDVRDALTDWLADCDLNWARGRLEARFATLPTELQAYRNLALVELVKIDIERCWRIGIKATAQSYLDRFPILRADESVESEVIQAEEEARRRAAPAAGTANRRLQDTSKIGRVGADSQIVSAKSAAVPEARTTKTTDNDLPESFGRYRIVRMLGHGGMGDVYLADDTQLNRQVALKVPHFDRRTKAEVLERFDREAKAVANLDHPNICRVHDTGEVDGQRFMVMEFIDGESLAEIIESKQNRSGERGGVSPPVLCRDHWRADAAPLAANENKWSDDAMIRLVQKVAAAVGAAHAKSIVHRDLKPANIMLTSDGQPKVTDFGLARRIGIEDHKLTHSGMILGTPAYMPPEQLTGELDKVGAHSDVFSLGVILFELLTGHLPHEVPPNTPIAVLCVRILTEPAALPTKFRPDLDPRLEAVILKATAKSHTDRYASMSDFSATLQVVLDEPRVEPSDISVGERGGVSPPVSRTTIRSRQTLELETTGRLAAPARLDFVIDADATKSGGLTPPRSPMRWVLGLTSLGSRVRVAVALTFAATLLLGTILWFRLGDAIVKIEVLADDVEVSFAKHTLTIIDGEQQYRVKPGEHRLHIKAGDIEFDTDNFTLNRGMNPSVKVSLVKSDLVATLGENELSRRSVSDAAKGQTKTELKSKDKTLVAIAEESNADLQARMAAMPAPLIDGTWSLNADELATSGIPKAPQVITFGDPNWKNYDLKIDVASDAPGMENSIIVHADETARQFWKIDLGAFGSPKNFDLLEFVDGANPWNSPSRQFRSDRLPGERGVWYRAEIQVRETKIRVLVDGQEVVTSEGKLNHGRVGVRSYDLGQARWRRCEVRSPDGTLLWKGWPNLKLNLSAVANADQTAAGIAKLKQILIGHEWKYFDTRYPPGDKCRFFENGKFHRWKWSYWVVSPKTVHIRHWNSEYDPNKCLTLTFNDDLTVGVTKGDKFTITITAIKP